MPSTTATAVIQDTEELRGRFVAGARPRREHRLGLEHEKIGVCADGRPLDFATQIAPLLETLARRGGWERVEEAGHLIGLRRGAASISLEPGGQVEFSDQPRETARACAEALDAHLSALAEPARALGILWVGAGFRPLGTLDEVPWMPKGRYAIMRAYLPKRGKLAHEMMKRTATVQANLDFADEAECADKVRVAMGLTSLVTALWANSPLVDGRPAGYQSYRAACWLDTDPDRCGLLPFVFAEDASETLFARYTEWALDIPMFFLYRAGQYHSVGGISFRRFLHDGFQGERATVADWELHLSTLFPEVRLRPYIEVRAADAGTRDMVRALPALCRGVLDDDEARHAAWVLVADWTLAERQALRESVPRLGLAAEVRGQKILARCRVLVDIARAGLMRLGDDPGLLDAVAEVASSGRSYADRTLAAYQSAQGDVSTLIKALHLM